MPVENVNTQPSQQEIKQLVALYNSGQLSETEARARSLVERFPGALVPLNVLGVALARQGKLDAAVASYQQALEINPGLVEIRVNLGVTLMELGKFEAAAANFRQALEVEPSYTEAYYNLGNALKRLGRPDGAIANYRKVVKINPKNVSAHNNLGVALVEIGKRDEAIASYQTAIRLEPKYVSAHVNLAEALEIANRTEDLRNAVREAERNCPGYPRVVLARARLLRRDGDYAGARAALSDVAAPAADHHFSATRAYMLGELCDRLGDVDAAFGYFCEANRACRQTPIAKGTDAKRYLARVQKLADRFTADWISQWCPLDDGDSRADPVFMVGFPRSGTTLLDTILRSHAGIAVVEEAPMIGKLRAALRQEPGGHPDGLATLRQARLAELRQIYFAALDSHLKAAEQPALVIDKLPLNITEAGLIHRIFPKARFVFVQRHPCDCVLSCFMQNFTPNDAVVNFMDLADAARTYDKVMSLWQQYQAVLPLQIHTVRYEALVEAFEETVAAVVDFLGVEWDDNVLNYAATARQRQGISTPSYNQVIEPLYTRALGRWQRYRRQLQPVLPMLLPWAERFGYREYTPE